MFHPLYPEPAMSNTLKVVWQISEISEYDPLDLFSGSKDRIHKAIRALYATPQNNFRVFLNGSLVFGGLGGGTCKTTSKVDQDFEHLLKDIIKTKDGSRANHFIELVAETVYTSGVLDHLLDVQKLDKYNIEGAVHVYYDLINQPCRVCKELEKSKTSSTSQFSSMHSIPMAEKVNVLKEFLISATAKDCSVMISFRSTDAVISRSSSHSNLHLESAKQEFDYKVSSFICIYLIRIVICGGAVLIVTKMYIYGVINAVSSIAIQTLIFWFVELLLKCVSYTELYVGRYISLILI